MIGGHSRWLRPGFRGEFAAASLKLCLRFGERALGGGFRGEFAAASLKRSESMVLGSLVTVSFRGEFAAASLKHLSLCHIPESRLRFRGEFAAASLKPRPF